MTRSIIKRSVIVAFLIVGLIVAAIALLRLLPYEHRCPVDRITATGTSNTECRP